MDHELSSFDFSLPPELIAQMPAADRTASRLLHLADDRIEDRLFRDLPTLLKAGDLVVINDTRVIKARLLGRKADSGGRIEALIERITDECEALAQVRASKSPPPGTTLLFEATSAGPTARATVLGREEPFWLLRFEEPVEKVLERIGSTPLPPYIEHAPTAGDDQRYQTVYAREPGAVAAPTAGLHFDPAILAQLAAHGVRQAFVTLHVGAGTFRPLRVDDIAEHRMHAERYHIPEATAQALRAARTEGRRVLAVGTTCLRALESAALATDDPRLLPRAGNGETQLFVTPGFRFRVVDRLITNFHLPRSTLMMLVCAFAGTANIQRAYAHAIAQRYRFFSYGDAMLLERSDAAI